jgi:hypothetical protein
MTIDHDMCSLIHNLFQPNEKTPLHYLAETVDLDFLKFMMDFIPKDEEKKRLLQMTDSIGNTCLHVALCTPCKHVSRKLFLKQNPKC